MLQIAPDRAESEGLVQHPDHGFRQLHRLPVLAEHEHVHWGFPHALVPSAAGEVEAHPLKLQDELVHPDVGLAVEKLKPAVPPTLAVGIGVGPHLRCHGFELFLLDRGGVAGVQAQTRQGACAVDAEFDEATRLCKNCLPLLCFFRINLN